MTFGLLSETFLFYNDTFGALACLHFIVVTGVYCEPSNVSETVVIIRTDMGCTPIQQLINCLHGQHSDEAASWWLGVM